MRKKDLFAIVADQRDSLIETARDIWETPELGLHEEKSASYLIKLLDTAGFTVDVESGALPTSFIAEYGSGEPIIGVLGEYDALPGLSQQITTEQRPIENGQPGHGCGHNLFGTAGVGAVLAAKEAICRDELSGTVRFYGCPAEEILVGKVFMAREGAFDDLDAALTWHPSDLTKVKRGSSLALNSLKFQYEGTSSHASAAPSAGRSALDAVQLLNTGVEYVREHVHDDISIHYTITDGGDTPNVVPAEAEVWYYIRAPDRSTVERVTDWLRDAAKGATLMTQTEVDEHFITGCYDILSNQRLADVLEDNLTEVGPIPYTDSDRSFASELQETFPQEDIRSAVDTVRDELQADASNSSLFSKPIAANDEGAVSSSTGDVGDVSYITPTAQCYVATWPIGTVAHSWQAVAASGAFGLKAVPYVSKVLAGTIWDLNQGDVLEAAQREFERETDGMEYETPLPDDATPPFGLTGPQQ